MMREKVVLLNRQQQCEQHGMADDIGPSVLQTTDESQWIIERKKKERVGDSKEDRLVMAPLFDVVGEALEEFRVLALVNGP